MRPILLLLIGNIIGTVAGGVFFLLASWHLDIASMGQYAVAISLQLIIAGVTGSSVGTSIIRHAVGDVVTGRLSRAMGIVVSGIGISAIANVLLLLSLLLVFLVFGLPDSTSILILTYVALWAGSRAILECIRSGFIATEQYRKIVMLAAGNAVAGLFFLFLMVLSGPFTLERLLLAHVMGQATGFSMGLILLRYRWQNGIEVARNRVKDLLRYARWPSLSEGTKSLQLHLGPLLLLAVSGAEEAGRFGLGRYPAYIFGMIGLTLYQYWLPRAAREGFKHHLETFTRLQLKRSVGIGVVLILSAWAARPLLPLLGANFASAVDLLVPNAIDFSLLLLILPVETAFHGLYKPQFELLIGVVRVLFLLCFALALATEYGAMGMAWAHILSSTLTFGLAVWLLRRNL